MSRYDGRLGDMAVADVQPATGAHWSALEDLFGRGGASNGCWCMYWLLGAEYHRRPREQNKRALRRATGSDVAPGLLAFDADGRALGWARFSPRSELDWLNQRRDLTGVDDVAVWSLPCFYVRSRHRGRGVMAALLDAAVERAVAHGLPGLEGYPIDTSVPGSTRNLFPGTLAAFERAGFVEVARHKPDRPIVRHPLR